MTTSTPSNVPESQPPARGTLLAWSEKLRAVASGAGSVAEADESGMLDTPRAATRAFVLAWLSADRRATPGPDRSLWLASDGSRPAPSVEEIGIAGWLAPALQSVGLEAWQESELAAVHALSWLVLRDRGLEPRLRSAARICIAELQPDNVTGRPWATHVFAWLSAIETDIDARLYAETLLHNTLIAGGVPDAFSAALMLDSARWLRAITRG